MASKKRDKKRNFFGTWRKCHGDPARILEKIGATLDDFKKWMKDPAFIERFEEAAWNDPDFPDDAEGLLLLAKELPFFKWGDTSHAIAKQIAALPEKERTAFFQRLHDAKTTVRRTFNYHGRKVTLVYNPAFRKKVESKVKQCLSGRFKPGFYSKKDKQIAELICDESLTDQKRAGRAGMTLSAFKMRKSAWTKNIAGLGVRKK